MICHRRECTSSCWTGRCPRTTRGVEVREGTNSFCLRRNFNLKKRQKKPKNKMKILISNQKKKKKQKKDSLEFEQKPSTTQENQFISDAEGDFFLQVRKTPRIRISISIDQSQNEKF